LTDKENSNDLDGEECDLPPSRSYT